MNECHRVRAALFERIHRDDYRMTAACPDDVINVDDAGFRVQWR